MRLLLGGLKSYLPIPAATYKGTGGTVSGAYCYTVWLRHLSLNTKYLRGRAFHPGTVVELGPGDSIGLGLAALLSGAETYIGLDVLEHASAKTNLRVFNELVELFRRRAPLPNEQAFPRLYPRLASYDFPTHLLDEVVLAERLSETNVARLRAAAAHPERTGSPVQYRTPWGPDSVGAGSADLVISQGTLQDMDHTPARDDLRANIAAMALWLKPGGVMSHHMDFSCPGGKEWNHHWAYGDLTWAIIRGNRPYYMNRVPLSEYITLFEAAGCKIVGAERVVRDGLPREAAAARFRHNLPDEDFCTAAALLVAVKR